MISSIAMITKQTIEKINIVSHSFRYFQVISQRIQDILKCVDIRSVGPLFVVVDNIGPDAYYSAQSSLTQSAPQAEYLYRLCRIYHNTPR